MMRFLLVWFLLVTSQVLHGALEVSTQSTSVLLINGKTGKVLYEKNGAKVMYPGSCTKIAFALYAIKFHKALFNTRIIASHNAVKSLTESQKSKNDFKSAASHILEKDASHMGLKVGEEFRFYELLEATMVVSADDASNVIAEAMGNGSIEKCVDDVNRFLRSIGCKSTHFTNPHGLHHPDHVTTAKDLALLCQEAMKEPIFCEMVKKSSFIRPKTNKQPQVTLPATNRMLIKRNPHYYPYTVGIKTGYHRRAGFCFAAQADKGDRSLIAIVLQAPTRDERFTDARKLFDKAFEEKKVLKTLLLPGSKTFEREIEGANHPLQAVTCEKVTCDYYPSEEPHIRCQLVWNELNLPLAKGVAVGELLFLADGKVVTKCPLFAANDLDTTWKRDLPLYLGLGSIALIALYMIRK